ncbi:MAG: hypothetical protein NXI10_10435 [bacterium]|nr:hypothetical protein [bacterium]
MKKHFLIFGVISAMLLASCGGSDDQENQDDAAQDDMEMTDENGSDEDMDQEEMDSSDDSYSAEDWDEVLDDYEEYVDTYISIIKKQKADPTDMSILTEYQELVKQGTEWSKKMGEMSSDFGQEQLTRMQEIQEKLAKAAM